MSGKSEAAFEAAIEHHLLTAGGYTSGHSKDYDRARALIPAAVVDFVSASQPALWQSWQALLGAKLPALFVAAVVTALDERGTLDVLRRGVEFYGEMARLAYFRPNSDKNPVTLTQYAHNRVSVVRQLYFEPEGQGSIDMVLFINGLPVITAELKNQYTHQNVEHGMAQYRLRDPEAPIFRWTRRALVHFAVDTQQVRMTTALRGKDTDFLPFDRGNGGGAGNPPVKGKHRTCYLWEEVWQRDSLIDLLHRFIHVETEVEVDPDTGESTTRRRVIFPRYHQLRCVRRLVAAARTHGAGDNYLVQHSAGSGKTNSIGWLAHRLNALHGADDARVFDMVLVLTDRTVLDEQLQDAIAQFDHKAGVVQKIDKNSAQLAYAIKAGNGIVISTLHKFGFIQDKIEALPDRRYAIIVDEAHSSQSGEMAYDLKALLAGGSVDAAVQAEIAKSIDDGDAMTAPDQLALRAALIRARLPNLSFFAFTATPKNSTLTLFGHVGPSGKHEPYDQYTMRQAIEEGFIVDVLKGYTSYQRYFELQKAVGADPEVDSRKAALALQRFVDEHADNVRAKTEIMVEHFRSTVAHRLGGRAKAMVVTRSRSMAVRYRRAFDAYIAEKAYAGLSCLVAFSGSIEDPEAPDTTLTEVSMNGGIRVKELPRRFASKAYQFLIVADKYQTGFDQPRLCAMYVDKPLNGITAVQTLSRLNRRAAGKQTSVLDFVNDRDGIVASFKDYFEGTTLAEQVEPERLYERLAEVDALQLWTPAELDGFVSVFYTLGEGDHSTHGALGSWLDPAVDRFAAIGHGSNGEAAQGKARGLLAAYVRAYALLGQVVTEPDERLEKVFAFASMLLRVLPLPPGTAPVDLGDQVLLAELEVKKTAHGDLSLTPGGPGALPGIGGPGGGGGESPTDKLSAIIALLNARFGPEEAAAFVGGVTDGLMEDEALALAAQANDKASFGHALKPKYDKAVLGSMGTHPEIVKHLYTDPTDKELLWSLLLDAIYAGLRERAGRAATG